MKVFISYAAKDGTAGANFIYQALVIQPELKVWLDTYELNPGEEFANRLTDHAATADLGILVFSQAVLFSEWCTEERRLMLDSSSRIIPVLWNGKPDDYAQLKQTKEWSFFNGRQPLIEMKPLELYDALSDLRRRVLQHLPQITIEPSSRRTPVPARPMRHSLSEWLGTHDTPPAFRKAVQERFGASYDAVLAAGEAVQKDPLLYFETIVKALWRADHLNEAFFDWLGKRIPKATAELKFVAKEYAAGFPGARHSDAPESAAGFLDRLLHVKEFGLILRPEDVQPGGAGLYFRTASGRVQAQFVTIWELYDEPYEYRVCIDALTELVTAQLSDLEPTCLVTSTVTGRHLVESIYARLRSDNSLIAAHYLSPELTLDEDTGEAPDLSHERVLLVTDVIASMRTVDNMVSAVGRFGGHVVGAVAAIYIGGGKVASGETHRAEPVPAIELSPPLLVGDAKDFEGAGSRTFRVVQVTTPMQIKAWALAHYPVPPVESKRIPLDEMIRVDPATILPEQMEELGETTDPLFPSLARVIEELDAIESLRFGLYRSHGRIVTGTLRFKPILSGQTAGGGAESEQSLTQRISEKIRELQQKHPLLAPENVPNLRLVTTHRQHDVDFADFVQELLAIPAPQRVHLPRREGTRLPNPFVLMTQKVSHVSGRDVLVVLGTIDSSDNLRAIVSLLASAGARSVFVLTLLSRMRFYSTNFLARIDRILEEPPRARRLVEVRFRSVFELPEVETTVLQRVVTTLRDVRARYRSSGSAIGLVRLADNEFKHFEPRPLPPLELGRPNLLNERLRGDLPEAAKSLHHKAGKVGGLRTVDGLLFLLSRDVTPLRSEGSDRQVVDRADPHRLLTWLCSDSLRLTKVQTYHLFALLLADLQYLNARSDRGDDRVPPEDTQLARVRTSLHEALSRFRELRVSGTPEEASSACVAEARMLFLLALLGAVDGGQRPTREFYHRIFREWIDGLVSGGELKQHAILHLTTTHTVLALSMLYRLRLADGREPEGADLVRQIRAALSNSVRPAIQHAIRQGSWSEGNVKELEQLQLARDRVDALLDDFGATPLKNRGRILRHLHATLFGLDGDNPRIAVLELERRVEREFRDTKAGSLLLKAKPEKPAKRILEIALLTCSDLERIARSVRGLFLFARSQEDDPDALLPYADEYTLDDVGTADALGGLPGHPISAARLSLLAAIRRLSSVLFAIRGRRRIVISRVELQELGHCARRIHDLLWGSDRIRRALATYVVDFRELLTEVVRGRTSPPQAHAVSLPPSWEEAAQALHEPFYLLCDRDVLEDVLGEFMLLACTEIAGEVEATTLGVDVRFQQRSLAIVEGHGERERPLQPAARAEDANWVEIDLCVRAACPLAGATGSEQDPNEMGPNWKDLESDANLRLQAYDGELRIYHDALPVEVIRATLLLRTRSKVLAQMLIAEQAGAFVSSGSTQ